MDDKGRWIFVGRARAMAHPKARLNLGLILCAIYFTIIAASLSYSLIQFPVPGIFWIVALGSLLTAIAIAMRWPFAYQLVFLMCAYLVGAPFLIGPFKPEPSLIAQVVGGLAVGMYFAEGVRPNLIYRHRFYRFGDNPDV